MNQYSTLLNYLKELAESDPLVSTVTRGDVSKLDLEKSNIFPLVHIDIEQGQFTNGQTIIFTVNIACVSERMIVKDIVKDKFWRQDNEIDNHNETLAVLNRMWTSIFRDWNNADITTSESSSIEKITYERGNILDGWEMTFDVEVSNESLSLC